MSNYRQVLSKKGFLPYLVAEFLGAFNDNAYKMVLTLMAFRTAADVAAPAWRISLIGGVFILPFILFSGLAGQISDSFTKKKVLIVTKLMEIIAMSLALFTLPLENYYPGLIVLFLMTTQSTFFGPAKYGMLPEIFNEDLLTKANGIVETTTFLAIILGTFVGAVLMQFMGDTPGGIGAILLAVAVAGWISILWAPKTPHPQSRVQRFSWIKIIIETYHLIVQKDLLKLTFLGIIWFWFFAGLAQLSLIMLGKNVLMLDDLHTGMLYTILALGVATGCLLAGQLSRGHIDVGMVPVAAMGVGIAAFWIWLAGTDFIHILFAVGVLGIFAGMYDVPLLANLQHMAPQGKKGQFMATTNFFSMFGVLAAAGIFPLMHDIGGMQPAEVLWLFGMVTAGMACYAIYKHPKYVFRFIFSLIVKTLYRIEVIVEENIPKRGPAILVGNHLSFIDGIVLSVAVDRPIHFMILDSYYNNKVFKPFCKMFGLIPVLRGKRVTESIKAAQKVLEKGGLIGLFPEGELSHLKNTLTFHRGFQEIAKGHNVPVIPFHLDNFHRSIFAVHKGHVLNRLPSLRRLRFTVGLGKALPARASPFEARQAVVALSTKTFLRRRKINSTLPLEFIKSARRHFWRRAMADSTGKDLTFAKSLLGTLLLARRLYGRCFNERMVGVLLPASVGGALVNMGLILCSKVAVNLNFVAGEASMSAAIQQCEIKTIITSHKFIEKLKIAPKDNMVFVEDLATGHPPAAYFISILQALCLPARLISWMYRDQNQRPDDLATVIFSSGSTGEPKGVMLSHKNILCNIESADQVFPYEKGDTILGSLPLFHSFGYSITMWLPVLKGLSVVFHPNPLEAKVIGKLVEEYKINIIVSTSTLYQNYIRICTKEQFASLKFAIAGAEKLKEGVRKTFKEKFGIELFEGYGCTELSPVVSVNLPDAYNKGHLQAGCKIGTVGCALPGIATKIVDPDTDKELPLGTAGHLLVMGGNRMIGYLKRPDLTKEAFLDEWYKTGDMAQLDKAGFITIVDRYARFSKIGGEMVPHGYIEQVLFKMLGNEDAVVVSIEDIQKGEALGVIYCHETLTPVQIVEELQNSQLPKLWLPKVKNIVKVKEIPVTGTGKIDLRTAKKIVGAAQ